MRSRLGVFCQLRALQWKNSSHRLLQERRILCNSNAPKFFGFQRLNSQSLTGGIKLTIPRTGPPAYMQPICNDIPIPCSTNSTLFPQVGDQQFGYSSAFVYFLPMRTGKEPPFPHLQRSHWWIPDWAGCPLCRGAGHGQKCSRQYLQGQ